MTSRARTIRRAGRRSTAGSGQALTEFALVLPILIILVVGVADFGRLFAAGITLESASRDAAENASSNYLANPPAALTTAAPAAAPGYYEAIHLGAARAVCAASRHLPGVTFDSATATCPGMPYVLACVHDGRDPLCGTEVNGASAPSNCTSFQAGATPTNSQQDGLRRYVEVRTCYRFDTSINVPLISLGTIWLERTRTFDIPCYYRIGAATCG